MSDAIGFTGSGNGELCVIADNFIHTDGFGINFGGASNPTGATITGNTIQCTGNGIDLGSNSGIGVTVANNDISLAANGIEWQDTRDAVIVGNTINNTTANGIRGIYTNTSLLVGSGTVVANNAIRDAGSHGINIDGRPGGGFAFPILIANNTIRIADLSGIQCDDIDEVTIVGNVIVEPGRHGIDTQGTCNQWHVTDNTIIRPGQETDNTYDGIFINANCDDWYVHGNRIDGDASTPQPRYAVNVSASTCDCNIVVGNKFGDPADYGTDAINDAGTDTQWTWPDDPVYGDNFTVCETPSS